MLEAGPALPWAAHEEGAPKEGEQQQQQDQEDEQEYITLEQAGLAVGDIIEVKWTLTPEDAESFVRWWKATVKGRSARSVEGQAEVPVYELEYEAMDEFEPETCHVILMSKHELFDLNEDEGLMWRKQGDTWDEQDEEEEEDDGAAAGERPGQDMWIDLAEVEGAERGPTGELAVPLKAVAETMEKETRKRLGGKTSEQAEEEFLQDMQPSQRIAVAAGFREFADKFTSFLSAKANGAAGNKVVITEEDVQEFMHTMDIKRPRRA